LAVVAVVAVVGVEVCTRRERARQLQGRENFSCGQFDIEIYCLTACDYVIGVFAVSS